MLFVGVIVVFIALVIVRHVHGPATHANAASTPRRPASFGIGTAECRYLDTSRSTPDYANGTTLSGRKLLTEVRYPTLAKPSALARAGAAPARRFGPYPLIVFAHGYDLLPDNYDALLNAWVHAGFVVAAPIFPATNATAVAADHARSIGENDDINQPGDVAFVLKSLLSSSQGTSSLCRVLKGLVSPSRVGLAGQSDGAESVAALGYDRLYREPNLPIAAVAVLSGQEFAPSSATANPYAGASGPALLITQSATDQCNPPQNSTKLYDDVHQVDKWFLKLVHANHLPPYDGVDPASFNVVATVTTDFFAHELAHATSSAAMMRAGNAHVAVATMTTGATAPAITALVEAPGTCYLGE